jgi:hypothetical protein
VTPKQEVFSVLWFMGETRTGRCPTCVHLAEDHKGWTLNQSSKSDAQQAFKSAKKIQKVEISTQKSRGRPAMERYEALRDVPARCRHPKEAEAGPTGKPW